MAAVGVVRFNFSVTSADHTQHSLELAIQEKIHEIPGISIAQNTLSIHLDPAPEPPENPPMPGFNQIRGSVRHRS